MSPEQIKAPSRRSLLTTAAAGVLLAGIVIGYGFISRAQSKQEVVQWTDTQATPTVALAKTIAGGSHHTLTLPGQAPPVTYQPNAAPPTMADAPPISIQPLSLGSGIWVSWAAAGSTA